MGKVTSNMSKSLPELRAILNGRVIGPGDAGYDEARTVFYGGIDRRPAVIVQPADPTEVSLVVSLARETGTRSEEKKNGREPGVTSTVRGAV